VLRPRLLNPGRYFTQIMPGLPPET
jgi:hypothetical protein